MRLRTKSRDPKGQTLVIVAVGMVVLVGMVGLVIDVGHAVGRQSRLAERRRTPRLRPARSC